MGNRLTAGCADRIEFRRPIRTPTHEDLPVVTIPGDGIGKEVIPAGRQILEALAGSENTFAFEFENFDWGGDSYREHGVMMLALVLPCEDAALPCVATCFNEFPDESHP